jgi:MoxR-like ATPase
VTRPRARTRASTPASSEPAVPAPESAARGRVLRALGIVGWDALDPVVVAALATEAPLLVIGPHGSAKTLLLARIADALGLRHRHYNASLLNFDDLVGFPVPDNGRLVYLQTPATIWDAESVFFDEVSRCRPDLQNKLFPIVHDRIVQGVPLQQLRFRWAAMNPPPYEGDDQRAKDLDVDYTGAEPLDVALADRFGFIVSAPSLAELSAHDQLAVLRDQGRAASDAPVRLSNAVEAARARLTGAAAELGDGAAEYVQLLASHLARAGHPVSTRRAVQIARNIVAVRAATEALDGDPEIEDAFFVALRASLPDAGWGRPMHAGKLLAAHKAAWEIARLTADSPMRALLSHRDPLRRMAAALAAPVPPVEAGQVLADSFAELARPAQLAAVALFMPLVSARPDLPAATVEPLAHAHAQLARRGTLKVVVPQQGNDWRREVVSSGLPTLALDTPRGRAIAGAAAVLLDANERFELDALARAYDAAQRALAAYRLGMREAGDPSCEPVTAVRT